MDFESMNLLLKRKPTKKSIELEVNKKYPLLKMMVLDTKYGPNIKIETPEFFCFIPNRYYQYLKESGVKKIQDMINQGRPLYILSMGAVSKTRTIIEEETISLLRENLNDNRNVGALIFDFDMNLTFVKFAKASIYLGRQDVLFITGAADSLLPLNCESNIIGNSGLHKLLEDFSGRPAIRLSKPGKELNDFVRKKFNVKDPSRTLFIGDSLTHDIQFANNNGYQSLLVLTGVTKLEDAERCSLDKSPHYYVNSIVDIHTLISDKLKL